eukprot:6209799-Pleurochrysis_carterae.AAC.3
MRNGQSASCRPGSTRREHCLPLNCPRLALLNVRPQISDFIQVALVGVVLSGSREVCDHPHVQHRHLHGKDWCSNSLLLSGGISNGRPWPATKLGGYAMPPTIQANVTRHSTYSFHQQSVFYSPYPSVRQNDSRHAPKTGL